MIRKLFINGMYTVANWLCLAADAMSPGDDGIWRERRGHQVQERAAKHAAPEGLVTGIQGDCGLTPPVVTGDDTGLHDVLCDRKHDATDFCNSKLL